jgi:hypothetical protein
MDGHLCVCSVHVWKRWGRFKALRLLPELKKGWRLSNIKYGDGASRNVYTEEAHRQSCSHSEVG